MLAGQPTDADLGNRSLLALWIRRTRVNVDSHNAAERRFALLYELTATLTLGGVVALGQVAIFADPSSPAAKVAIGLATAVIAVLSATSVIWDFRTKNIEHRAAARMYARLRRAMEELSQIDPSTPEAAWRRAEIRRAWDAAAASAPNVPNKLRERARERFEERYGQAGNELPEGL
jgi:hypothetical protein